MTSCVDIHDNAVGLPRPSCWIGFIRIHGMRERARYFNGEVRFLCRAENGHLRERAFR